MKNEKGTKNDNGKCRLELLDAEWLEEVGWVLTHGAKLHSDHNWRNGLKLSRVLGSILRHTLAILRGEDIDSDSGLSHTAHLGCECMFFFWLVRHRPDLDDRYKYDRYKHTSPTSEDTDQSRECKILPSKSNQSGLGRSTLGPPIFSSPLDPIKGGVWDIGGPGSLG